RDTHDQRRGGFAVHPAPRARLAVFGDKFALAAKGQEGVEGGTDLQDHIPAPAPVAPIRPTVGDVFFASEVNRAIATVAGTNSNRRFIEIHGEDYSRAKS